MSMPEHGEGSPFGSPTLALDPEANVDLPRPLEPGADPCARNFVHFVADGTTIIQGHVARVLGSHEFIADLVFVSDDGKQDLFPILLRLRRSDATAPWVASAWERLFSEQTHAPLFEEIRVEAVQARYAHLVRRVEHPLTEFEAALRSDAEMANMRAVLEQIRGWHDRTGRAWALSSSSE